MLTKNRAKRLTSIDKLYALTISSNYATHKNAYKAYKYIIRQMPEGCFNYIHEVSKNGKYHIHGIMDFKYKFNFFNLKKSLVTECGRQFDIHLQYRQIPSIEDEVYWYNYSSKNNPQWKIYNCVPEEVGVQKIPVTCIPQIIEYRTEKAVRIPGI